MTENRIRRGIESETLLNRGLKTYHESQTDSHESISSTSPERNRSSVDQINELTFVVIRNEERTLAVYRVTSRGDLKPMEKWPTELD